MRAADNITVDHTLYPQLVVERFAEQFKCHPGLLVIETTIGGVLASWLGAELGHWLVDTAPLIKPSNSLQNYFAVMGLSTSNTRMNQWKIAS